MTVFGFGRLGLGDPLTPLLTGTQRRFTLGLIDETRYAAAAPIVRGAYQPLSSSLWAAEDRDLQPITTHVVTFVEPFLTMFGEANGGSLDVVVDGVLISIVTFAGQSTDAVAAALAAAILADPTLNPAGGQATVQAIAAGPRVVTDGVVGAIVIDDPGLSSVPPVPALDGLARLSLALLVSTLGHRRLSRALD